MVLDYLALWHNPYVRAVTIFIAFYVVSELVVQVIQKIVLRITNKTKTTVDDMIANKSSKPISLIIILIGLRIALETFSLEEALIGTIEKIIGTLIIIILAYLATAVIDIIIDAWGRNFAKKTRSSMDDAILPLFHRFIRIVVFLLAALYVLDTWGVAVGPLLASLGIAGIAIAFALQNTLGNIFGGISIILDKSIKVGDVVKIGQDISGTVLDVGLRSTKIRTWDNEVMIMPNGKLADSTIQNFVLPEPSARVIVEFGVAYGSHIEKVKKVAFASLKGIPGILKDPAPFCNFDAMADSAMIFKLFFYVEDYSIRFNRKEKVICALYNNLNKARIEIPFPQRVVWMKKAR